MAKVVKKGKSGPSWVGMKLKCPHCDCTFKLERGDRVETVPDQRDGDYYKVSCPECHGMVTKSVSPSVSWDPMDR
ncbi:MAG: hypothetical protein Q7S09_03570 [bacterium]|nr:hypothetical protein [bacterium]